MKRTVIFFLMIEAACLSGASFVHAQTAVEKGLNSINRASAEAIVGFLADDELQGREAGLHGSRIAARYLAASLKEAGIRPLYGDCYFQPFDVCAKERQQKGARWQVHPDSIARLKEGTHRVLHMANVLGVIPGRRTDEYVIVGAHFDHIGMDETLADDPIYNGADDNASGVSAVLQIARAFQTCGQKPLRNVIIAFWDGEEKGLLGSKHFVQSCDFIGSVKGYLNFFIDRATYAARVLGAVLAQGENYGSDNSGAGKTVVQQQARLPTPCGLLLHRRPSRLRPVAQGRHCPLRLRFGARLPRMGPSCGRQRQCFVCRARHPRHLVSYGWTSRLPPTRRPCRPTELGESGEHHQSFVSQRVELSQ